MLPIIYNIYIIYNKELPKELPKEVYGLGKPAYKKQVFVCEKCLAGYKFTMTTESEIVQIEEMDK